MEATLGVWGLSSQLPEALGPGDGAPSARKFCFFLQKLLNFRYILIKNRLVLLKRGMEIGSANMIKLIALMGYGEVANDNIVVLLFTRW